MASMDAGVLLTVPEVARQLRVSLSTVYKAIDAGRLPAVRVGPRALRIAQDDLLEYLLSVNEEAS